MNRINTAVASSCYSSNHVFTPQLPKPTGLPSYSQINCSNFTPTNFSLNFLVAFHLICPQLLSSRDTLDLACAIFQYLFIVYHLFVISLLEWISVRILRDKWGDQVWGKVSLLFFTSFIHLCHSFPSLGLSVVHALRSIAVTSGETQAKGGKSFRLHLGSNSPCSISARV